MKMMTIMAGATMMCAALPAAAQTLQTPPASPCQAQPDQNGTGAKDGSQPPPAGDLTQKLDPCDGVLTPPPTGDSGIAEPAPDQGNTPVIKPGELPQQPPKQ